MFLLRAARVEHRNGKQRDESCIAYYKNLSSARARCDTYSSKERARLRRAVPVTAKAATKNKVLHRDGRWSGVGTNCRIGHRAE